MWIFLCKQDAIKIPWTSKVKQKQVVPGHEYIKEITFLTWDSVMSIFMLKEGLILSQPNKFTITVTQTQIKRINKQLLLVDVSWLNKVIWKSV